MSALITSSDGSYIFMALENEAGQPIIVRSERDSGTFTSAYNPAAGTAGNVAQCPGDPDLMFFYGNFGTDLVVIRHTVSTGGNEDISPATLGAKVVNGLAVNPSDSGEIWITINTDQDLLRTIDGGENWESLNAALDFNPTVLLVFWNSASEFSRAYIAGHPVATQLLYTVNDGNTLTDVAGASLAAGANIVGLEGSGEAAF